MLLLSWCCFCTCLCWALIPMVPRLPGNCCLPAAADDGILGQIHTLVPLAVLPLPVNALVYTLDGVLVGASDFG